MSSFIDITEASKTIYVDRYGISSLTDFTVRMYVSFRNQSLKTAYVRVVINDPNANWTFDDGTTSKNLGSVPVFGTSAYFFTLKRPVPETDTEESFNLVFEVYKDSNYTQLLGTSTKTVNVIIADFRNAGWLGEFYDFEDGTAQGWTLNLFSISQTASIEAGGYGLYYYFSGTCATRKPSVMKEITIPQGVSKAGVLLYYGAHIYSNWDSGYAYLNYVRFYVNDELIAEDYVNKSINKGNLYAGWYQTSADLSDYIGQTITLKIEFEIKLTATYKQYIKLGADDIMIIYT